MIQKSKGLNTFRLCVLFTPPFRCVFNVQPSSVLRGPKCRPSISFSLWLVDREAMRTTGGSFSISQAKNVPLFDYTGQQAVTKSPLTAKKAGKCSQDSSDTERYKQVPTMWGTGFTARPHTQHPCSSHSSSQAGVLTLGSHLPTVSLAHSLFPAPDSFHVAECPCKTIGRQLHLGSFSDSSRNRCRVSCDPDPRPAAALLHGWRRW